MMATFDHCVRFINHFMLTTIYVILHSAELLLSFDDARRLNGGVSREAGRPARGPPASPVGTRGLYPVMIAVIRGARR